MLTGFSPHRRPVLKQSTLYHPSLIFWRTVHMSTFNVCRIIFWYKFLVCLLFVTSLFSFLPEASLHKLQDTYYGEEASLKFWSSGIFFFSFFLSLFLTAACRISSSLTRDWTRAVIGQWKCWILARNFYLSEISLISKQRHWLFPSASTQACVNGQG